MKAIKGHVIFTREKDAFCVHEYSYIIVDEGRITGIYKEIPSLYGELEVEDYGEAIIIPSFIDLHIHAPQFMQMGIGLNLELIDWLNNYTFMLEGRFSDVNYAKKVYPHFVQSLYDNGTLRSCIYGTVHDESNRYLVEALKEKKLSAYVGKVNMNRFAPVSLIESTERSIRETEAFIKDFKDDDKVKSIVTPRFAPSCTDDMLEGLGKLVETYHVPIQSHLAENRGEIEWVKELFPASTSYSNVYDMFNLYGKTKTLMAHGIYLEEEEVEMAKNPNVFLVHCPNSNLNLTSGIMPLTKFLDDGLQIGMGSDVGAGHRVGMQHTITSAIQCSKVRQMMDADERILSESEAFYLATNVNGRFFGDDVGTFENGYYMDALVIKDPDPLMTTLTPLEQLQRFLYCGTPTSIVARYLEGDLI